MFDLNQSNKYLSNFSEYKNINSKVNQLKTFKYKSQNTFRKINEILTSNSNFDKLYICINNCRQLNIHLNNILPKYLHDQIKPISINQGILVLITYNASVLIRTRYLKSKIIAELNKLGWKIYKLKTYIVPLSFTEKSKKNIYLSSTALSYLYILKKQITPYSPLYNALSKLLEKYNKVF